MLASNPLLAVFLFLHVAGAVLAFGPTFTFPFIGSMGGKEPQHVNFALRVQHRIASNLVMPLALFQAVTGIALIWVGNIDLFSGTNWWLVVGIVLYLIALSNSMFILLPHVRELITLTSMAPPAPAEGAAPSGPPPRVAKLVQQSRQLGALNALLIIVIIFLMVTRPF
jgi:uncharacterized membrane protein